MKFRRMCDFLTTVLIAGILYSGCLSPDASLAQNTQCSDRPTTDSSNACANTRFVQAHVNSVVVPISAYGAKCDDSTDDTLAIQSAWNAAALVGDNVWLGGVGVGICKISSLTMPTPTPDGKASFLTGPASSQVKLSSTVTGTTCAINVTGVYGVTSWLRGAFQGFELEQRAHTQSGYGWCIRELTQGTWRDVKTSWFFRGVSAIDTTSIDFLQSTFYFNQIGAYGAVSTLSPPNDWTFFDNKFQSNGKNAISLTGPSVANIISNEFQSNGYNFGQAPTGTIDIIGPPGGPVVGASITDNRFEGNEGTAEIRLDQNSSVNGVSVYNIKGNSFIRSDVLLAQGILVINTGTGTSKTTVNLGGNGFYDDTGVPGTFTWVSAQTSGTTNYLFNCVVSNRVDVTAEMPTLCRNNVANTVAMVDANAQYIGYGTQLQLTALINVATATLSGAVPAWPNDITKFFRGDGTYAVPTAGSIAGGVALTKTDDTNVTLILGGTPATALLQATSITVGWSGTLAAARLNSNVVQAITNDANITGSIAAQNLTLAWAGTLANARLATMATNTVKGNATSGTASPTDLAVGTCSTASSALIWTTNTGFGCNTAITASFATNATNTAITDDTTTNATMNITWVTSNTGNLPQKVSSTKLNFNPSTGTFSAPLGSFSTSVTSPLHIGGSGTTGTQFTFKTTTGVGTTDQYSFTGGNNGASSFGVLSTNGLVIGSTTPDLGTSLIGAATPFTGASTSAIIAGLRYNGSGAVLGAQAALINSRGAAPGTMSAVQAGDGLGGFIFGGDNGVTYLQRGATIRAAATTNWTNLQNDAKVVIAVTATGSTTTTDAVTIHNSGGLSVGTATDPTTGKVSALNGFVANGLSGITTVCTIAVGNVLTFTLGIITAKGGVAGCT